VAVRMPCLIDGSSIQSRLVPRRLPLLPCRHLPHDVHLAAHLDSSDAHSHRSIP